MQNHCQQKHHKTSVNIPLPNTHVAPWKLMVGRLLSFWEGLFSDRIVSFREGKLNVVCGESLCSSWDGIFSLSLRLGIPYKTKTPADSMSHFISWKGTAFSNLLRFQVEFRECVLGCLRMLTNKILFPTFPKTATPVSHQCVLQVQKSGALGLGKTQIRNKVCWRIRV